jgi:tellurite resistance protein
MGQTQPYTSGRPLGDSLFAMWRCVIAVAHADGLVHEEELAHFAKIFGYLGTAFAVTPEQRERFEADLKQAQELGSLLPRVTDAEQRCLLVNFAHVVAHVDGELHPNEAALLTVLDKAVPETPETAKIRDDIRRDIVKQMAQHAGDQMSEEGARSCTLTYALNALLHRLGIATE